METSVRQRRLRRLHETAIAKFGSIDHVVNNAGIFSAKPFTDYTIDEFRGFVSTNLEGFIFITQRAVKQMLTQGTGGSVTTITASLADNPMAGVPASIPMITKGGLECDYTQPRERVREDGTFASTQSRPASSTPLCTRSNPKDFMKTLSPMGTITEREGHRRGCCLSDGSSSRHRGGAARGRRCARGPMVGGKGSQPGGAERRLQDLGIQLPARLDAVWSLR